MSFLRSISRPFILLLLFAFLRPVAAAPESMTGRVELRFLDERHLALVCIYDEFLQQCLLEKHAGQLKKISADPTCKEWSKQFHYTFAMAQTISEYRPTLAGCLQYYSAYHISGNQITEGGYWLNSTRLSRVPDQLTGKPRITANADVAHYVFLTLAEPLKKGQQYQLEMPTGKRLEWQYQGKDTLSYLYKFNQLGFSPSAKRKYAYLGGWLGDAGALDISRHLGKEFKILSSKQQKTVFKGIIKERNREAYYGADKVKYTGE
ncbi:MAG: hypothetical protein WCT05_05315, partial [Lentisphaeria bacterium]